MFSAACSSSHSALHVPASRALWCLVFALTFSRAVGAQRELPARFGRPPAPGAPRGRTPLTGGDSPLTHLETFSGRVDVLVQVKAYTGQPFTSGTFTVAGLPSGASILRAWVQLTSFDLQVARPVALTFAGVSQGARLADAVDVGGGYQCSMYRFDVTHLVTGNGAYSYSTTNHQLAYGDSLVVV